MLDRLHDAARGMVLKITLLITEEVVFDKENGANCYAFSTNGAKLKQLDSFLYL